MPQMAPLNWIMLMIYFIMILLMFNYMNYFIFLYIPKIKNLQKMNFKLINWKW
nr:ATP synthase F0 subunit 8 [Lilioceris yunnana]